MFCKEIDDFLRLLKKSPSGAVFNPWWEVDERNDVGHNAPAIRRNQLRAYLEERLGKSKVAIIGEALGYRGGHFSGIPMTSERMLLGKRKIPAFIWNRFFPAFNHGKRVNLRNIRMVFQSRQQPLCGAHC